MFIRNLTVLLFLASCSATTFNFKNIKFDDSFTTNDKYELKKCLNSVIEDIDLRDFNFSLSAENITSQGLEFNTKYIGILTLNIPSQDKNIPIQAMRMNTANYISSNMADEERKRIKSLILLEMCQTIQRHVS